MSEPDEIRSAQGPQGMAGGPGHPGTPGPAYAYPGVDDLGDLDDLDDDDALLMPGPQGSWAEVPSPESGQYVAHAPDTAQGFAVPGHPVPPQGAVQQPAMPQPVAPQPVVQQPVAHQPVVQQPGIPQPVVPQSSVQQPAAPQAAVPQPVVPQPVAQQPVAQQPVLPQPVAPQPVPPQLSVPQPSAAQPPLQHSAPMHSAEQPQMARPEPVRPQPVPPQGLRQPEAQVAEGGEAARAAEPLGPVAPQGAAVPGAEGPTPGTAPTAGPVRSLADRMSAAAAAPVPQSGLTPIPQSIQQHTQQPMQQVDPPAQAQQFAPPQAQTQAPQPQVEAQAQSQAQPQAQPQAAPAPAQSQAQPQPQSQAQPEPQPQPQAQFPQSGPQAAPGVPGPLDDSAARAMAQENVPPSGVRPGASPVGAPPVQMPGQSVPAAAPPRQQDPNNSGAAVSPGVTFTTPGDASGPVQFPHQPTGSPQSQPVQAVAGGAQTAQGPRTTLPPRRQRRVGRGPASAQYQAVSRAPGDSSTENQAPVIPGQPGVEVTARLIPPTVTPPAETPPAETPATPTPTPAPAAETNVAAEQTGSDVPRIPPPPVGPVQSGDIAQPGPTRSQPAQAAPAQAAPEQAAPTQQPAPAQPAPAQSSPAQPTPVQPTQEQPPAPAAPEGVGQGVPAQAAPVPPQQEAQPATSQPSPAQPEAVPVESAAQSAVPVQDVPQVPTAPEESAPAAAPRRMRTAAFADPDAAPRRGVRSRNLRARGAEGPEGAGAPEAAADTPPVPVPTPEAPAVAQPEQVPAEPEAEAAPAPAPAPDQAVPQGNTPAEQAASASRVRLGGGVRPRGRTRPLPAQETAPGDAAPVPPQVDGSGPVFGSAGVNVVNLPAASAPAAASESQSGQPAPQPETVSPPVPAAPVAGTQEAAPGTGRVAARRARQAGVAPAPAPAPVPAPAPAPAVVQAESAPEAPVIPVASTPAAGAPIGSAHQGPIPVPPVAPAPAPVPASPPSEPVGAAAPNGENGANNTNTANGTTSTGKTGMEDVTDNPVTPATPAVPAPTAPTAPTAPAADTAEQGAEAGPARRRVRVSAVPQAEGTQPSTAPGENAAEAAEAAVAPKAETDAVEGGSAPQGSGRPAPAQPESEPAAPSQPVPPQPVPVAVAAAEAAAPSAEAKPEAEAETQAKAETEAEAESEARPEAAAEPESDAESEPEAGPESVGEPLTEPAPGYDHADREAVHRVMRDRRDVRTGFRSDPVPDEVLIRVLEAAHQAPSVGYSQPWDFVVIRSEETRAGVQQLAARQREAYAASLPKARAKQFLGIKTEAILETPVNIVVTVDSTRGGRHTLGRHTQPQMGPYSSALAVENLWLAARAEGLGVGWVSFFDERELSGALGLPEHLEIVAYLCVGYVDAFPDEPELAQSGWAKQRPLSWVVHEEEYGRRGLPGEEPVSLLDETIRSVRPLDAKALSAAWDRHKVMTKPAGSLGVLEMISAQLAGLARTCPPPVPEPAAVAVFAADHGVHAQGVSPWPQEVTAQMVHNFLAGGAVVNAFARQIGVEVCVVDVGVASELPAGEGLLPRKVRPGTADMTQGPAMSREEVLRAIEVGIETARDLVTAGNRCLLTGDMGIANTTASAALIAVFTGTDAGEVTGRGTGIDDSTHDRKVKVVRAALAKHAPDPDDPIGVLAAVGGLEHAALAGFIIGAAAMRTPVVLDGVIAGAAALAAHRIAPDSLAACIAGHRSAEPGHGAALAKLGLRPLVELELRLGEGTGAVLALPLVQSAARVMHDVATFDSAGVSGKTG